MIFYTPSDRDVYSHKILYRPKSCFLITQLGEPLPDKLNFLRGKVEEILKKREINIIDANSLTTGGDFLLKIWKIILSVPMGIAIITEEMKESTISNIFYELGLLNALGKESIVIKTKEYAIPSDFVRTEYIQYSSSFEKKLNNFINNFFELSDHYDFMAENLSANPILAIDYLRRGYLISGNKDFKDKARRIFDNNNFDDFTSLFIRNFLKG